MNKLMDARRALRGRPAAADAADARRRVNEAKVALGERGPVWWTDGAPDFNRKLVKSTPYAEWFERVVESSPANVFEHPSRKVRPRARSRSS